MAERKGSLWVVSCLFTVLLVPKPAAGDPVAVTGGFLFMNGISGPLEISGERGFSMSSGVDVVGGLFNPYNQCFVPECTPVRRSAFSAAGQATTSLAA